MHSRLDIESALSTDDPRVSSESVHLIPQFDSLGDVLLVGVVHDHPASIARVGHILTAITPDVLALELPSLALPLFKEYADGDDPPSLGGEMSMALWAAGPVHTVGIDAPSGGYVRQLARRIWEGDLSGQTLRALIEDLGTSLRQAVTCRVGGVLGALTGVLIQPYPNLEYDCSMMASPDVQAAHETDHIETQQAFFNAVEIPEERSLMDEIRETSMALRLHGLRQDGTVIAVLGVQHVEPVERHLEHLARS